MNAADHPTWLWIKKQADEPSRLANFVIHIARIVLALVVWYFTDSQFIGGLVLILSAFAPYILVCAIDICLRIRFSLRFLIVAILTLQIPITLFFTANSAEVIGIGIALLLIWVWFVVSNINDQLETDMLTADAHASGAKTE